VKDFYKSIPDIPIEKEVVEDCQKDNVFAAFANPEIKTVRL